MKSNTDAIISEIPVVILAGGAGINLGSQGSIIPKAMVEINGIPLLLYIMDHYGRAGFRKFIICGGYRLETINKFISRLPDLNNTPAMNLDKATGRVYELDDTLDRTKWEVIVLDTGIENMTGSRLAQARAKVDRGPMFCLTYGDTLSDVTLPDLLSFHINHRKTGTLLAAHNPTRFRILGLCDDDDLIKGFSKKPVLDKDYVNGGFYFFNSSIFDLKTLSVEPTCVLETDVLEELISKRELYTYRYDGFWQPLDNERDKQKISQILSEPIDYKLKRGKFNEDKQLYCKLFSQ